MRREYVVPLILCRRVDPLDPETTELPLAGPPVVVRVLHCMHDLFSRGAIPATPCPRIPGGTIH